MMFICKSAVGRMILGLTLFQGLQMVHLTNSYDQEKDVILFGKNGTFSCQYFCDTSNNNESYLPPYFTDNCPPADVLPTYISTEDESGVNVFWTEPVADEKNSDVPRIEQVSGDKNGSYFNGSTEGTIYNIVYLATNKDGLKDNCHFQFKVYGSCTTPVVVKHGNYNCTNGTTPGSVCTYKCNVGYRATGKTDVICQSSNQTFLVWSAAPTCEVVYCKAPFVPNNATITCNYSTYSYNSICSVTCDKGFTAEGPLYMICQEDGKWSRPTTCTYALPSCPKIFNNPLNGRLIYSESDTFVEVTVNCDIAFDLQYKFPGYISCVEDKWKSNRIPGCNVKMKTEYLLYVEIIFYGQGCSENAKENFLEYKKTFHGVFDEFILTTCPQNETCRVFNVSVDCFPTPSERVRKEIPEIRSNFLHYEKVASHDVFKRSAPESFMISFTIEVSNRSLIDDEDFWENNLNFAVRYSHQISQEAINFTIDHFRIINQTVLRCDNDHILDGSLCRTCSIGFFYNKTSDICQTCPVGTFKDTSGLASCLFCPGGTSTKGKGSVSMNDCKEFCHPGSFSPDGLMTCAVCPKGFYQGEFRQTDCKKCPKGKTTVLANSTDIRQCTVIDSCLTPSCNGHKCLSNNGSAFCACSHGWSGKYCEQPPEVCSDNLCMNRAICMEKNSSYACECKARYTGMLCEIKPVNGGWTEWSGWSKCSVTCDQGTQQRTRQCTNPSPSEYGENCYGQMSQDKVCVRDKCKACSKLKETNSSFYQCKIAHETGLETCSVRCKDGYIKGHWSDPFQYLSCGMQTGFYWLPANLTLHCSEPIMPKYLLLESSIEYNELIPSEYHDKAKIYVRNKLLHTDCFKSASCKMEVSLKEVNIPIVTDETYKRSKLYVEIRRYLQRNETNRNTREVANRKIDELKYAIEDMESTAIYMNEFPKDVFELYLDSSSGKSIVVFTPNVKTVIIHGQTNCENGQVVENGICIECPPGTYTYSRSCIFCNKGTYQPYSGQTICIKCPADKTTDTYGADQAWNCQNVEGTPYPNDEDSDLTVAFKIGGILLAILALPTLILSFLTYRIYKASMARRSQDNLSLEPVNSGNRSPSLPTASMARRSQDNLSLAPEQQESQSGQENISREIEPKESPSGQDNNIEKDQPESQSGQENIANKIEPRESPSGQDNNIEKEQPESQSGQENITNKKEPQESPSGQVNNIEKEEPESQSGQENTNKKKEPKESSSGQKKNLEKEQPESQSGQENITKMKEQPESQSGQENITKKKEPKESPSGQENNIEKEPTESPSGKEASIDEVQIEIKFVKLPPGKEDDNKKEKQSETSNVPGWGDIRCIVRGYKGQFRVCESETQDKLIITQK